MERKGQRTEKGDQHREIAEMNRDAAELRKVEKQIEEREDHTAARRQGADAAKDLPNGLRGTPAAIWEAVHEADSPQAIAAALRDRQIELAATRKEEAERSREDAASAQEKGKYAPVFREGELVAVDRRGFVYRLTEWTTGTDARDMQAYMRTLDRSALQGIDATRQGQQERREAPAPAKPMSDAEHLAEIDGPLAGRPEKPSRLKGTAAQIWDAMRSDSAPAFIAALQKRGLEFARVHEADRGGYLDADDPRQELARLQSMKEKGIWLMQTGGAAALNDEQKDGAQRSYDNYKHHRREANALGFGDYVSFVQDRNAQRLEALTKGAAALNFADGGKTDTHRQAAVTARAGTYVVINERGYLYHINERTTGLSHEQIKAFLQPMDGKKVQSVTAAREVVADRHEAKRMQFATSRRHSARNAGSGKSNAANTILRTGRGAQRAIGAVMEP